MITSALEDQRALDNGPREGHSLFAGYLLEGLTGGLGDAGALITGSQIAQYVRNKIIGYRNNLIRLRTSERWSRTSGASW